MHGLIILTVLVAASAAVVSHAQEIDYAHYVESVQVVVDEGLGEVSASVVLQSTNTDDIRLPESLERDLRENERIIAALFTDADTCILGVVEEACVIVNMARVPEETNIILVQDGARNVADEYIARLNAALGTDARFHSVFVHHNDDQNKALGVSGIIIGYNTVSVVYTLPHRGTPQFFEMLVSSLLAPRIAEGGGFVDAGRILASHPDSTVTFVAAPGSIDTQMMLKVTRVEEQSFGGVVNPLEMLGIDEVVPSAYFDDGFYPLNSLVRVAVASGEGLAVSDTGAAVIPVSDGTPDDVTATGWFFDPSEGTLIRGTYLMGEDGVARADQTAITLGVSNGTTTVDGTAPDAAEFPWTVEVEPPTPDLVDGTAPDAAEFPGMSAEGPIVVAIIVAAGIGAAVFYLKGYRR